MLLLQVCYLRHAFGLGDHYNSTKQRRVRFSGIGDSDDEDEGDGDDGDDGDADPSEEA
jgi:hypothetical protein